MFDKYFNPNIFAKYVDRLILFFTISSILLISIGIYWAIFISPDDYQQGNAVKIMYIHVPAAWLSLFIYSFMAISSLSYLIWRNNLSDILARKSAIIGANFTLITLVTGSIWGNPFGEVGGYGMQDLPLN